MNKLDDFIDIFGLNVGKDEVREDKNGNKYKLFEEMEKKVADYLPLLEEVMDEFYLNLDLDK